MNAFTIPAQFTGCILTQDKGAALRFRTQSELSDEEVASLKNHFQESGVIVFAYEPLSDEEIRSIKIVDRKGRTPSQELRAVLHRKWEQEIDVDARDGVPFEIYYKRYIYTLIAKIKDELE